MSTHFDLDKQLDRTVDWLKLAEAKNAVALTLVSALLFTIIQANSFFACKGLFYVVVCILLVTIFLILFSFQPILSVSENKNPFKSKEATNLYFFKDIAEMKLDDFRANISKIQKSTEKNYCFDNIIDQIWKNAGITNNKLLKFKYACFSIYFVIIMFLVAFMFQWIFGIKSFNF